MSEYRFYLMTADEHIARAVDAEAEDDASALQAASELQHLHTVEVWKGASKVGMIKPRKRA